MPKVQWTKEQLDAIYEKGSNILVAAAAGSGKTAVLVERIINKILNEKIDIDKLLVVTFTNAAASEMRERVLKAIYKKLDEDPENTRLQRQITLLNKASICTIDSFCLEIVRNNFYELDNISPNFKMADPVQNELLKQEILEEIFEKKYEEENKDFVDLINTYTSYRDDSSLKDLILTIYNNIRSNPFPEKWLKEKIEMFNIKDEKNFFDTPWGQYLHKKIEEETLDCIRNLKKAHRLLKFDIGLEAYERRIVEDIENLENLKDNLEDWNKAYEAAQEIDFVRWPSKSVQSTRKDEAKKIRDEVKGRVEQSIKKILIFNSEEAKKDINEMYKILIKLQELILEFSEEFEKRKRSENILDFHDIELLALKILMNEENQPTDVAKRYQERYEEIAIDEYQDSNLVQEYILNSVSKGNNIFMVGDVKQSIYKFRQSMPELFLEKYKNYKYKENKTDKDNIKIKLFKNFRSRKNILDFTNLIFQNIMSDTLGDIEYDEEEYLNLGADYPEISQNLKTEINVIDLGDSLDEEIELENISKGELEKDTNIQEDVNINEEKNAKVQIQNTELQAKFVAKEIKKLIDDKFQVWDNKNGTYRDIQYKDIVILLRTGSNVAPVYEEEILKLGMPVFSDSSQEYLGTMEIRTIMSVLKIIDNPIQDIPLVTILRSPIFKFTDDELVKIRLSDKYSDFYTCMKKSIIDVDKELKEKIEKVLQQFEIWRKEQEFLSLDELIWKIYLDTGFYNYVGLMPNGELRQANLKMLFQKAKQYENANFKGLYNFINFIDKLTLSSGDMGAAKLIGENENVVRIMSIHKSKGLEFPVVFLSSTERKFNFKDLSKNILLHKDLGIGVRYIDYNLQIKYDTLSKKTLEDKMSTEIISEEMRILYVALTRAKEKLIITGTCKNYEDELNKMIVQIEQYEKINNKINPVLVKKYKKYLDWILLVYQYEKEKRDNIELNVISKQELLKNIVNEQKEEIDVKKILEEKDIDMQEVKEIKNIVNYSYPYKKSINIQTKTSVTNLKEKANKEKELQNFNQLKEKQNNKSNELANTEKSTKKQEIENVIELAKPQFVKREKVQKISGAQKGTLVHLCMQRLDEKVDYDIEKVKDLIKELENKQIITHEEASAIDSIKILNYTKSKIWQEVKKAKEVYKEKPFYINIPAKDIYDDDINEEILVQGIIDLYYIDENNNVVLVDYKTDYVEKEEELVNKYSNQLELYEKAIECALKRPIHDKYIYSVHLEKEIKC